jgi:tetratricopeptide (TPR) repeat protein
MAESSCLHIQEKQSGPIRVIALPWLWARVGRASYCEIRLNGEDLPDEVCRLQRKGRTWYVLATSTEHQVVLGGREVRGSSPLPFDVPIEAAGHRLTLRPDISFEPVWEIASDPSLPVVDQFEATIAAASQEPAVVEPVIAVSSTMCNSAEVVTPGPVEKPSVPGTPVSASSQHRRGGLGEALRRAELAGLPGDRVTSSARPKENRPPSAGLAHHANRWEAKWRAASAEIRNRPKPEPVVPAVERKVPKTFVPPPSQPLVPKDLPRPTERGRVAEHTLNRPALATMTPPISRVAPISTIKAIQQPGISKNTIPPAKPASQPRAPLPAEPATVDSSTATPTSPLIASSFDAVNELIASRQAAPPVALKTVEASPETEVDREVPPPPDDTPVVAADELALEPVPDTVAEAFESATACADALPDQEPAVACDATSNLAASDEKPVEAAVAPRPVVEDLALDFGGWKSDPSVPGVGTPPPEELALDPRSRDLQNRKPRPAVEPTSDQQPENADQKAPVIEQAASKPVLHDRPDSPERAASPDRSKPVNRTAERRPAAAHRDVAAMARTASKKTSPTGPASVRPAVDWPSAASVLALHRSIAKPTETVSRNRHGQIQAMPTRSSEPDHWNLPAWLALPPVASVVLLVGAAGLLLSCIWASDSYNASYVMHALLYGNPASRRQAPPTTIVPPPGSWARTTGQHLAYWGMYKKSAGAPGDSSQAEAAALLAAAVQVSPMDPLARLGVAQLESRGEHSRSSSRGVGMSRDSLSLAWSARSLAMAGKKPAALALYVRALDVASREDLLAAGVPRFNEDPKVPRYFLPGEGRFREIIRSMAATDVWTIQEWTEALPASPVVRLAAARILREQGRGEADALIERILAETKLAANEEVTDPLVLAARAEALAIKGGLKDSGREYRQAIEAMPNDWIRRSWWFNLADIAYRMEDETERQSALRYALAVATSDDITRRATDTQRAVSNRRALGSARPRAN